MGCRSPGYTTPARNFFPGHSYLAVLRTPRPLAERGQRRQPVQPQRPRLRRIELGKGAVHGAAAAVSTSVSESMFLRLNNLDINGDNAQSLLARLPALPRPGTESPSQAGRGVGMTRGLQLAS